MEGEDVDLPQRVGNRAFEAAQLRRPAARGRRRVAQACLVDRLADRLGADGQALVAAQFVPDAADAVLRVLLAVL